MSSAWWTLAASAATRDAGISPGEAPTSWPVLASSARAAVLKTLLKRVDSYTPEWTKRGPSDAGIALAHLFSEEAEPVLQRLNRLPENAFLEFLRIVGIQSFPPVSAEALVQFTASDTAPESVYVPEGFQVGASAVGGGGQVIFETASDLYVAPAKVKEMYGFERGFYRPIPAPGANGVPFQPFGAKPRPGVAFLIGLSTSANQAIGPQLSLGVQVQGVGGQPPVATGGVVPLPAPLSPLLRWDVLSGGSYKQADVVSDETNGLLQSGVITLALPDQWTPGIPPGAPDTAALLWLRLEIRYGNYLAPPTLTDMELNVVRVAALRTIYNEVLTPVKGTNGSLMMLSQTPVVRHSLKLQIVDGPDISQPPVDRDGGQQATSSIWTEVDNLADYGPTAQVYTLNPANGEVQFGNGVNGMPVPPGYRNVVARKYQVGSGKEGAVGENAITNIVNSVPFLSGVTNPWPATGGIDEESQATAMARGPKEIRARGRAVAPADYEVLALHASGALVDRVHAVPGLHPSFAGVPIPGVVGVFVIPAERGAGPPTPNQDTLRAVSSYLSATLAPAGVEVVAAAPVYHTVQVMTGLVVDDSVSRGETVNAVVALLNKYLDPVWGGDDGAGWPFGGALLNVAFVRKLLTEVHGVSAVQSLRFVVDGVSAARCADAVIPANSLVWPGDHQILVVGAGEQS